MSTIEALVTLALMWTVPGAATFALAWGSRRTEPLRNSLREAPADGVPTDG